MNPSATPEEALGDRANYVWNKYFTENAKYSLNLDSELTKQIKRDIQQKRISRSMFSEAQDAVFKLMETACVAKFFTEFMKQEVEEGTAEYKIFFLTQ